MSFLNSGFVQPIKQLTPYELLVAIALGAIGGLFPIPMTTTIITVALCKWIPCSVPQVLFATALSFICVPFQFAMVPVFARAFAVAVRIDSSAYTVASIRSSMGKGILATVRSSAGMFACSVAMWLIAATPTVLFCRSLQAKSATRRD